MASTMIALETLTGTEQTAPMSKVLATSIVGGLSNPSKMPGKAYGISASLCITGSKLAKVEGSTCHGCYALKNFYVMPSVKKAHAARLTGMSHPRWIEAMTFLVSRESWFRWHDSGDLQSVDHLRDIVAVVNATPNTKHWMPTREYAIVKQFLADGGTIPSNLVIRLSAHMIDAAPQDWTGYGLPTSGVHHKAEAKGSACPAPKQGNECKDCRACWNSEVQHVSYHKH